MSPGQGGLVCDLKPMIRPMRLSADMLLFWDSYCRMSLFPRLQEDTFVSILNRWIGREMCIPLSFVQQSMFRSILLKLYYRFMYI
jgi:hypothetical protein